MTVVVLDANVVIRLADETERGHAETVDTLAAILDTGVEPIAPDVLVYELGNHARRDSAAFAARDLLDAMEVCEYRQLTLEQAVRAYAAARERRVTFHDSSYLTLAEAEGTLLWTEDAELLEKFPERAASTADILTRLR